MLFDESLRLDVLAAADLTTNARDARPAVESMLRELLSAHPEVHAIGWSQSVDHPSPEILLVHGLVFNFTDGSRFEADNDEAKVNDIDAELYARVADLVLAQVDLLLAAFGLGVGIVATRDGVKVTWRVS